jgi:protein ImuA
MDAQRDIHALRQILSALGPARPDAPHKRVTLGTPGVDRALGGGLCRGALHEIVPAEAGDAGAAAGFVAGLCLRAGLDDPAAKGSHAKAEPGGVVWIRQAHGEAETGGLYAPGLAGMGLSAGRIVQLRLRDVKSLLRAGIEAAGCPALGALVIEPCGEPPLLDLTATRRLALAAERSGTTLFMLRTPPRKAASAALTRWRIAASPSHALEANAPGAPAFEVTLSRNRAGREGLSWRLEWCRVEQRFAPEALLRPVVSLPAHGPAAPAGQTPWREAG